MDTLLDLQASLPTLRSWAHKRDADGKLDFVEVDRTPRSFVRDGMLFVSMEEGDGAGDYNGHWSMDGEEQDGIPYIADALVDWAKANKGYWEWQDGGSIVFSN